MGHLGTVFLLGWSLKPLAHRLPAPHACGAVLRKTCVFWSKWQHPTQAGLQLPGGKAYSDQQRSTGQQRRLRDPQRQNRGSGWFLPNHDCSPERAGGDQRDHKPPGISQAQPGDTSCHFQEDVCRSHFETQADDGDCVQDPLRQVLKQEMEWGWGQWGTGGDRLLDCVGGVREPSGPWGQPHRGGLCPEAADASGAEDAEPRLWRQKGWLKSGSAVGPLPRP